MEPQHLLVSEAPEVLPYRWGVVEGVGLGRYCRWWCGAWRGGVVLVGEGGRRRVRGPVMGFPLVAAGGGTRALVC